MLTQDEPKNYQIYEGRFQNDYKSRRTPTNPSRSNRWRKLTRYRVEWMGVSYCFAETVGQVVRKVFSVPQLKDTMGSLRASLNTLGTIYCCDGRWVPESPNLDSSHSAMAT